MKRLAIAAVGLALLMVGLGSVACTRTAERLVVVTVVVTATPGVPSPTPPPNLSAEEAIGIVRQRETTATGTILGFSQPTTWGVAEFTACAHTVAEAEYSQTVACAQRGGSNCPGIPMKPMQWKATQERPGKWRVELICSRTDGPPTTTAVWVVDDKTLRVVPVGGLAD